MSNEEKIREINGCPCPFRFKDCEACFNRISLLEMAQWKTQQAIERITKLLNENCGDDWYIKRYDGDAVLDREELLKDIIHILKED